LQHLATIPPLSNLSYANWTWWWLLPKHVVRNKYILPDKIFVVLTDLHIPLQDLFVTQLPATENLPISGLEYGISIIRVYTFVSMVLTNIFLPKWETVYSRIVTAMFRRNLLFLSLAYLYQNVFIKRTYQRLFRYKTLVSITAVWSSASCGSYSTSRLNKYVEIHTFRDVNIIHW
jgi:hypothetical protein